uniref:Uncharacterized protein n=1 Tax=Hucho hucho TaxID=62062 RepID=A0A4W5P025_9TELE
PLERLEQEKQSCYASYYFQEKCLPIPSARLSDCYCLNFYRDLSIRFLRHLSKVNGKTQRTKIEKYLHNMAVAGCPDYFLHHPNYQDNVDRASNHRPADLIGPSFQKSTNRNSPNHQGWCSKNVSA